MNEICRKLESEAVKGTNLAANIKPYFNGNQYFLSVFKIFRDVRLVGAPNSAIGKFGGDTITGLGRVTREIFPFYEFMQDRTMNRQQYPIRTCLINRLNSLKFRHGGARR